MSSVFLKAASRQFNHYRQLAENTFLQLSDEQLFWAPNEDSNSIAVIVKHMRGNMLSRWTDFLTADGEKTWRERDAEFENDLDTREELLKKWEEGWACLFNTLENLAESDLQKTVTIRTQPLTVMDAILRQVAHYAYHAGQIVYIGKSLKGSDWNPLSIPKGGSAAYLDAIRNAGKPY